MPRNVEAPDGRTLRVHEGRQDLRVPYAPGEWLAERIPTVEAELSDDHGHLTLVDDRPHTLGWSTGSRA